MTTIAALIASAKSIAQDSDSTPFLHTGTDYEHAVRLALRTFEADVPNTRIVHHTLTAVTSRVILHGVGALAELTGLNAWQPGRSRLDVVWCPYGPGLMPLDPQTWRVLEEPDLVVLELAVPSPATGTLRLEFVRPHVVGTTEAATSVREGDVDALALLVACHLLEMYAAGAVQNTGSTGFPSDVVNRQSTSFEASRRAGELRARYKALIGVQANPDELRAASAILELDVDPATHPYATLWHPRARR